MLSGYHRPSQKQKLSLRSYTESMHLELVQRTNYHVYLLPQTYPIGENGAIGGGGGICSLVDFMAWYS